MVLYYLNTLVLIPKFLSQKKITIYCLCVVGMIGIGSAIDASIDFMRFGFHRAGAPFKHVIVFRGEAGVGIGKEVPPKLLPPLPPLSGQRNTFIRARIFFPDVLLRSSLVTLLIITIGGVLTITKEFFNSEAKKKLLENEKLTSELNFLKSQINPHFLFNTLNNIYSLANKKSDQTELALLKLSQILRYVIYKSPHERVSLEQEITYIKDFIDLNRLRLVQKVKVFFEVKGETDGILLPPMLLIPFIENAFKHGVSYSHLSAINIFLESSDKNIFLRVFNLKNKSVKDRDSGIGLQNVARRLNLIYPDKHTLTIRDSTETFIVELKIDLSR
jgi:two-component system, LytTR family, sensor kinase